MAKKVKTVADLKPNGPQTAPATKKVAPANKKMEPANKDQEPANKKQKPANKKQKPANAKKISKKQEAPKIDKPEATDNPPQSYSLLKEIKKSEYYSKRNNRNEVVRRELESKCTIAKKNSIFPGQLVMFNYFNPKTKEELEYYDAMPVTIFCGKFNTSEGKRVLGFNLHFYPATLRYRIMNKIFETFKPIYLKYWNNIDHELDAFDYRYIVNGLQKAKMDFGVRMYIPELIGNVHIIQPKYWYLSVFTEGAFKKKTRAQIMKFWQQKK